MKRLTTPRGASAPLAVPLVAVPLLAGSLLTGCGARDGLDGAPGESPAVSAAPQPQVETAPPEPAAVVPAPSPAQQRVPTDLRAKVASLMVVGAANYDQARAALDQGVGGLVIPSWADPALLTEEGRDNQRAARRVPSPVLRRHRLRGRPRPAPHRCARRVDAPG